MAEAISPPPAEPSAASDVNAHVQGLKENAAGSKVSVGFCAQLRVSYNADYAASVVSSILDQPLNRTLTNGSAAQSAMSSARNNQTVQSLSSGEVCQVWKSRSNHLKC